MVKGISFILKFLFCKIKIWYLGKCTVYFMDFFKTSGSKPRCLFISQNSADWLSLSKTVLTVKSSLADTCLRFEFTVHKDKNDRFKLLSKALPGSSNKLNDDSQLNSNNVARSIAHKLSICAHHFSDDIEDLNQSQLNFLTILQL